jgi:hypothetical protein
MPFLSLEVPTIFKNIRDPLSKLRVTVEVRRFYGTPQLGSWWLHGAHLFLCPRKIFRHGNKNPLLFVMVYSALFYNVFKALNLFLNKYLCSINSAAWQWHLAALHTTEVLHRVLDMASHFKLPSRCKTCSPSPFLELANGLQSIKKDRRWWIS